MVRKYTRRLMLSTVLVMALLVLTFSMALPVRASQEAALAPADVVAGEMVVWFEKGTSEDFVYEAAAQAGAEVLDYDPESGLALFGLTQPGGDAEADVAAVADAASAMDGLPHVQAASPNAIYRTLPVEMRYTEPLPPVTQDEVANAASLYFPGDPVWPWGWLMIDADMTWNEKSGAPDIAFLDTGLDKNHPEFSRMTSRGGYDYVNNDSDYTDDNGHGTHVTGVAIAKSSKMGSRNVETSGAPGVSGGKAYVVKVADAYGEAKLYDLARGLDDAAAASSVKVINISFVGPHLDILQTAVANAVAAGKLLVVAAGNNGTMLTCDGPSGNSNPFPACYVAYPDTTLEPSIIVVGATGDPRQGGDPDVIDSEADQYCPGAYASDAPNEGYTNYNGPAGIFIDLVAPGTDIYSTLPTYPVNGLLDPESPYPRGYGVMTGTSVSTAYVSGVAARLWGQDSAWTADFIKDRLTGDDPFAPDAAQTFGDPECWHDYYNLNLYGFDIPMVWMAGAMQIAGVTGKVYDANTGAAAPGTKITVGEPGARGGKSDTVCDETSVAGERESRNACEYFDTFAVSPLSLDTLYQLSVSNGNLTNRAQVYNPALTLDSPGWHDLGVLALPGKANWTFVTTWDDWDAYDLDIYLFLPSAAVNYNSEQVVWIGLDEPIGVSSISPHDTGELIIDPWARLMYNNAGCQVGADPNCWPLTFDSTAVAKNGSATYYPGGTYTFVVAESIGTGGGTIPRPIYDVPGACAYAWNAGTNAVSLCVDSATGDPGKQFWVVGTMTDNAWTTVNELMDEADLWTNYGLQFDEPIDGSYGGPALP